MSILSSPGQEVCEEGPVEDLEENEEEEEDEELVEEEDEEETAGAAPGEWRLDATLTNDIVEPLQNFALNSSSPQVTEKPASDNIRASAPKTLLSFRGADDEVCSILSSMQSNSPDKRIAPFLSREKPSCPARTEETEDSEEELDEDDLARPESPFFIPDSSSSSSIPTAQPIPEESRPEEEDRRLSADIVPEPLVPLNRTRTESRTTEAMAEFFTPDEVGGHLEPPSPLEEEEEEEDALYVPPLDCRRCGASSLLPDFYWEDLEAEGSPFLCDSCFTSATGHEECEAPQCHQCRAVAEELCRRAMIRRSFLDGTLQVEEIEEDVLIA